MQFLVNVIDLQTTLERPTLEDIALNATQVCPLKIETLLNPLFSIHLFYDIPKSPSLSATLTAVRSHSIHVSICKSRSGGRLIQRTVHPELCVIQCFCFFFFFFFFCTSQQVGIAHTTLSSEHAIAQGVQDRAP